MTDELAAGQVLFHKIGAPDTQSPNLVRQIFYAIAYYGSPPNLEEES
jgi:hypothetical protein